MKLLTKNKVALLSLSLLMVPAISFAKALINPLGTTNINSVIGTVIKAILGISGSAALLMFVWGGFLWLTSAGNTDRIKKGKDTLVWAVIGLAVIFSAYTLVNAVVNALSKGSVI